MDAKTEISKSIWSRNEVTRSRTRRIWDFAPFDRMIIPVEVFMYKINFISDPTKGKNEQEKVHKSCNWATAT